MEIAITDKEYETLVKRLEFFDAMRNNLLTFSFTVTLAVLGIALAESMDTNSSWLCLVPFFLIIPFAARISYYRLASAHINSFLRKFAPTLMNFEIGSHTVSEERCRHYKLIAWLVNHEMFCLGMAATCTFYFKYALSLEVWDFINYLCITIPIIFNIIVYIISESTYNYKRCCLTFYRNGTDIKTVKKIYMKDKGEFVE